MSRTATLLPLSEAAIGKRFRLVKIDGGHRMTRRLLALGLSLGTELEVVQRRGQGVHVERRAGVRRVESMWLVDDGLSEVWSW